MTAPHSIIGQRFGKLVVLAPEATSRGRKGWRCQCDCGEIIVAEHHNLMRGQRGCTCVRKAKGRDCMFYKHGMCRTAIYTVWAGMISRCADAKHKAYENYGGRGILVCDRWKSFDSFFADMGHQPFRGATLERENNSGNYEPGNVHWATKIEQANNKRNNRLITFRGETLTLAQWAEKTGLKRETIAMRLRRGWSAEKALTVPRSPKFRPVARPPA